MAAAGVLVCGAGGSCDASPAVEAGDAAVVEIAAEC